jgi:hypothetical protein
MKYLTSKEKELLDLINLNKENPIKWKAMPKQEVYTHIYGWDNPHIDINKLLTPKEKEILISKGYTINNNLKNDPKLLSDIRKLRKNPRLSK